MKNLKTPQFLKDDSSLYFIIISVLLIIILIKGMYFVAGIGVLVLLATKILNLRKHEKKKKELRKYIMDFTNRVDSLSRQTLLSFPMPLIIISEDGNVYWYNSKFKDILNKEETLENILDFYPNFPLKNLIEKNSVINIDINSGSRNYNILFNEVESKTNSELKTYILYWINNTAFSTLKNMYNDEKAIAMIVKIDNYEEISQKMDKIDKASMVAQIEKKLNIYATRMNGVLVRDSTDRFVIILEKKFLSNLETKKFKILEEVKEMKGETDYYFTLSIGVGANGKNLSQQYEYAKGALDIALGRGGDQAVVKKNKKIDFYGGKSKAVEKTTKVKARTISYALKQIIEQSSNVIIMGHKTGDMDSFGASIGIYSIVRNKGKEGYIVLNESNPGLNNLFERFNQEEESYKEALITTEEALKLIDEETVCIVVDTHKASFVEAPELLDQIDKTVIIDHHRRSKEYIENTVLDYVEPYASSTCELVSEIISYIGDDIKLTNFEAEALLAGILVDTNIFAVKTGVRTFEAASFLRRNGADTTEVRRLFSEDMSVMKKKSEIIERAEIVNENIAISYSDEYLENGLLISAQSADDLLTVKGIKASFVLSKQKGYINISGRSTGDINVQLILEVLGGGGHLTTAGAQLETENMQKAKEELLKAIQQYKKETEK